MSTSVGGLLLCTHFTQFLFPVAYLWPIRHSAHQCFYGFCLYFVASLFVFCLVASLLLISSLSISKHPKAHSAGGTIRSTRVDNRMNDVRIIQTNYLKSSCKRFTIILSHTVRKLCRLSRKNYLKSSFKPLTNFFTQCCHTASPCHSTNLFYLIAGRWQRRWLLCSG